MEIKTLHHSTRRDDATITTLVKSAVDQAMEAIDTTKKKPDIREKKLTTQDQPCKHLRQVGQTYVHKDMKELKIMNPNKKGGRPPWATKKLKKLNIEINANKLQRVGSGR